MGKLDGRVAIITGASRGQGEATARIFAAEGARVVVADVLQDEGTTVAASLGKQAIFQKLDVSNESDWAGAAKAALDSWGRIDILINNAAIVHAQTITETTLADWQRVIGINLTGAWLGIKTTAPEMEKNSAGAIVNISSMAGLYGMNGLAAYQSSKWGLRGLTKAAAMELGPRGIRVNAIFPGGVNTPMGNLGNEPVADLAKYFVNQPIARIGEPEEIARASLFLVSDDSSYIHGAELAVDGGRTTGEYDSHLPGFPKR
ncbi:MAG: glucose 1-dehydrogenase [Caulobacterales bacterium]